METLETTISAAAPLLVKNNIQKRPMNFKLTVVIDEAQFPKLIHERADS